MLAQPSAKVMQKATYWLIQLQCSSDTELDAIWGDCDDWFQAKESHREAYRLVRQHWVKLSGRPPDSPRQLRKDRYRALRWHRWFRALEPEWLEMLMIAATLTLIGRIFHLC